MDGLSRPLPRLRERDVRGGRAKTESVSNDLNRGISLLSTKGRHTGTHSGTRGTKTMVMCEYVCTCIHPCVCVYVCVGSGREVKWIVLPSMSFGDRKNRTFCGVDGGSVSLSQRSGS